MTARQHTIVALNPAAPAPVPAPAPEPPADADEADERRLHRIVQEIAEVLLADPDARVHQL